MLNLHYFKRIIALVITIIFIIPDFAIGAVSRNRSENSLMSEMSFESEKNFSLAVNQNLRVPVYSKAGLKDRIKQVIKVIFEDQSEGSSVAVDSLMKRREFIKVASVATAVPLLPFDLRSLSIATQPASPTGQKDIVAAICRWLVDNVAPDTGVILSFQLPQTKRKQILSEAADEHERMIWERGLVIYDGAVRDIALALITGDLRIAGVLTNVLWDGTLGALAELHASKSPFRYFDPASAKMSVNLFNNISSVEGWWDGKPILNKTGREILIVSKNTPPRKVTILMLC